MNRFSRMNIPKHVAIIMDPPAQRGYAQTAYSAVLQAGCFGGRDEGMKECI
jgi:hypothetical protein